MGKLTTKAYGVPPQEEDEKKEIQSSTHSGENAVLAEQGAGDSEHAHTGMLMGPNGL